jgi:hypothetical protein
MKIKRLRRLFEITSISPDISDYSCYNRIVLLFNYSTVIYPLLKELRDSVVELSGVKAGDRVLDVGCGTGD